MAQNINYNYWHDAIKKMSEEELLDKVHNSAVYDPEYVQIVKTRLTDEFHHSSKDIEEALNDAEIKYKTEKIIAETDRPITTMQKFFVIVGIIIFQMFAVCYVLGLIYYKKKNSLGVKRNLYDEKSRKWLMSAVLFYFFICLILYIIMIIVDKLG